MKFLTGNFEEPDQQSNWLLLRQVTLKLFTIQNALYCVILMTLFV